MRGGEELMSRTILALALAGSLLGFSAASAIAASPDVNSASLGIKSLNWPCRPATAWYVSSVISSSAPILPLLTTTPRAENTSSVVGNRPVLDSEILEPFTSLPVAGLPLGAARSMCNEPSKEVCATVAVELAGRTTFLSSANLTAA